MEAWVHQPPAHTAEGVDGKEFNLSGNGCVFSTNPDPCLVSTEWSSSDRETTTGKASLTMLS